MFSIFAFAYKRASGQDFAAEFRPSPTLKSSHAPLNVTSAGNLTTGADTTTFISAGGVSGGFNNGTRRANATLLMLARNNELEKAMQSVRELEEKFNRQFGYPWVFLNNMPFSQEFKEYVLSAACPCSSRHKLDMVTQENERNRLGTSDVRTDTAAPLVSAGLD